MNAQAIPPPPPSDDTRSIVLALRAEAQKREGASTVWRLLGGTAATIAILIAGAALTLAQQAAVDHEVVTRHEHELQDIGATLVSIQEQQAVQTAIMQRVEHQLDARNGQ